MIPLRWIGAVLLILGIASLFIPIPRRERHGVQVGDVSLSVVTQNDQKLPVPVSTVMILSGVGVMIVGVRRSS
jgi:hypothetical protein